jgi:hypothetical protein
LQRTHVLFAAGENQMQKPRLFSCLTNIKRMRYRPSALLPMEIRCVALFVGLLLIGCPTATVYAGTPKAKTRKRSHQNGAPAAAIMKARKWYGEPDDIYVSLRETWSYSWFAQFLHARVVIHAICHVREERL